MTGALAYDLGGSGLRVAIVGPDGAFEALARVPLASRRLGAQRFEADPERWWRAFVEACADLAAQGADLSSVTAVAGCGFTRTQVFLDRDGQPLRPAITFEDARAADMLRRMREHPLDAAEERAGALGPFDPPARLLWVRRNEPGVWARLCRVVEPKDFLNARLTGRVCSDVISQASVRRGMGAAAPLLFDAPGPGSEILPGPVAPFDRIGAVRAGLPPPLSALAGLPVLCGSMDTWSCVLGSGGLVPGVGYAISGTSDVSGVIASEPCEAEGLIALEWGPGLWQLGGPSQGAATRLSWAVERLRPGTDPRRAVERALSAGGPAPLFLPFIDGERTPLWDPKLRGAFLGLDAGHGADELVRGVAEGINYLSRDILRRAEAAMGRPVRQVCFSGGLSADAALCQLKADVLDRPVLVPSNPETGLLGAACMALGPDRIAESSFFPSTRYTPDPSRTAHHDRRFALFKRAIETLSPLLHDLAAG